MYPFLSLSHPNMHLQRMHAPAKIDRNLLIMLDWLVPPLHTAGSQTSYENDDAIRELFTNLLFAYAQRRRNSPPTQQTQRTTKPIIYYYWNKSFESRNDKCFGNFAHKLCNSHWLSPSHSLGKYVPLDIVWMTCSRENRYQM